MSGNISLTIGAQTVTATFGGTNADNAEDLRNIVAKRGYDTNEADFTPRATPADHTADDATVIAQWFVDRLVAQAKRDRRLVDIEADAAAQAARIGVLRQPFVD